MEKKSQKAEEKKIPKDKMHEPRKVEEALTSPAVIHRQRAENGVQYYDGISYDPDGNPVLGNEIEQYKVKISKATTDLSGAFPYVFDALAYICTHAKQLVRTSQKDSSYYDVVIPYDKFIDLCIDESTFLEARFKSELYQLMHKEQAKIIPFDEHTSFFGFPLVIALKAGTGEKLKPQILKIMKNLKKIKHIIYKKNPENDTGSKKEVERVEFEDFDKSLKPVGSVEILFLKSLFRNTLENKNAYTNAPKGLYAYIQRAVLKVREKAQLNDVLPQETEYYEDDHFISSYNRLWHYLHLRDNDTLQYWKYPEEEHIMSVSIIELLLHIAPQYVQIRGEKMYVDRGIEEVKKFINCGMAVFVMVESKLNTDMQPVAWYFSEDNKKLIIFRFSQKGLDEARRNGVFRI
jgi:hypothetical protein